MDVLKALENILERTPRDAYACPPLSRQTLSAVVAEIRRLREQLAAAEKRAAQAEMRREYESVDAYNARIAEALRGSDQP